MPKDTFFNLPEERRKLIFSVAINEFANHTYEAASVNRIVAESGIAKGSFYQYFADKKDLFLYVVELVSLEKARYLSPALQNPADLDFFSLLRELYISGIRFAEENPEYAKIGDALFRQKESPIYQEVVENSRPVADEFFENLLEDAIQRGDVRAEIDTRMFAFMIASMNALVVEYYMTEVDQAFGEAMMNSIDEFIEFLRVGIGAGERENPLNQSAKFEMMQKE